MLLLSPPSAHADGIDLPLLTAFGVGVALPLLAFNVVVEGLILAWILRDPFRNLWRGVLWANVRSLLWGLPVMFVNAFIIGWLSPAELVARMRYYPLIFSITVFTYFVVTVWVEYRYLARCILESKPWTDVERSTLVRLLKRGVLWANVASYAVLGPLYVMYVQPTRSLASYEDNTQWANRPAALVLYVSPAGRLERILTDGTARQTVLTNEVRDFVVSADLGTILFRGSSNNYFLSQDGDVRLVTANRMRCWGEGMDFSPSGRYVGLLDERHTLLTWDRQSGQFSTTTVPSLHEDNPILVWSTNENVFYAGPSPWWKATIPDGGIDPTNFTSCGWPEDCITNHYARVSQGRRDREDSDWDFRPYRVGRPEDPQQIHMWPGLDSRISARSGPHSLVITDNPGLLHISKLYARQAFFLPNNREIVFSADDYLYLADVVDRKVGRLAAGKRPLSFTPAVSKAAVLMQPLQ